MCSDTNTNFDLALSSKHFQSIIDAKYISLYSCGKSKRKTAPCASVVVHPVEIDSNSTDNYDETTTLTVTDHFTI